MAKQTELKHLLQELEIATRHHERCNNFSSAPGENARAFHAADVAEKRVFSFFDKLSTELEDSTRAYKSLQEQRNYLALERDEARKAAVAQRNVAQNAKADLQELTQQVMAMKPTDTSSPAAATAPFDEKRAAAGEPIEVLMSPGLWIEKQYVGTFRHNHQLMVMYVHNGVPDWAPLLQSVRMKAKPSQQLQMFADVFSDKNGNAYGYLHSKPKSERVPNAPTIPGIDQLASDAPVTITVAK